jgi:acyl-CoA thioester hydrolase
MPEIFIHNFTVKAESIDDNNHVNNVVYVQWMQDIAVLHSTAQGWSLEECFKTGVAWVAKSHYVEYKNPAFLNDEIVAYTWVSEMNNIISLRKYKFIRKVDSKIIAEAETEWVFVKIKSGRPTRIPDSVKNSFQIVPKDLEP